LANFGKRVQKRAKEYPFKKVCQKGKIRVKKPKKERGTNGRETLTLKSEMGQRNQLFPQLRPIRSKAQYKR